MKSPTSQDGGTAAAETQDVASPSTDDPACCPSQMS